MNLVARWRERLRMDPPVVLLERSFINAIIDEVDPDHAVAVTTYRSLVDDYEAERVLLRAVSEHLPGSGRSRRGSALSPVDPLHVAGQHRRAVDLMLEGDDVDDATMALTLVMLERHAIRRVATFDPRFTAFDLDIIPLPANT